MQIIKIKEGGVVEWFVWNEETEREYPGKHCETAELRGSEGANTHSEGVLAGLRRAGVGRGKTRRPL